MEVDRSLVDPRYAILFDRLDTFVEKYTLHNNRAPRRLYVPDIVMQHLYQVHKGEPGATIKYRGVIIASDEDFSY